MRRFTILVLLSSVFAVQTTLACRFAPGYRTFELSSTRLPSTGPTPSAPVVSVLSLKRGSDDGNFASCSDAGILTIAIEDGDTAKNLGFLFEVESGSFPDKVLPDDIVSPIRLENGSWGFYFVWLDLPQGKSSTAPIDVRISVRAVSLTMVEGSKVFLNVRNP